MTCLVCENGNCREFDVLDGKRYWRCERCLATFVDPEQMPSRELELAEYRLHQNDPRDPGYCRFLSRITAPLLDCLAPARRGLDYGCGPGPALAGMMEEAGHSMTVYDPLFRPDQTALTGLYDFITCTETVEHFHRPAREFRRLDGLLKPGGWLGVMTCFQTEDSLFAGWHYRRDPTHVVFYREATFRQLAKDSGWDCYIPRANVALLRKPVESG